MTLKITRNELREESQNKPIININISDIEKYSAQELNTFSSIVFTDDNNDIKTLRSSAPQKKSFRFRVHDNQSIIKNTEISAKDILAILS